MSGLIQSEYVGRTVLMKSFIFLKKKERKKKKEK